MKPSTAGLIGAVLAISVGLSGCGDDSAAKAKTPDKAKAAAKAKAAKPAVKASSASAYSGAEAMRAPKAAATVAPAAAVAASAAGAKSVTASSKDTSKDTSTSSSSDTGSGSSGYGSSGYGSTTGTTTGTIADTADTADSTVKSALLARAQTLSTHLLVSGLTYTTRDGQQQTYDAYLPTNYATATSGPYAFVIHGGDWSEGAKEDVKLYAIALAQKGIVAIAPNYRLAPTSIHPTQVNDIADVMAYIQTNSSVLFTTGNTYGAVGVAVGGQLASLVALSPTASGRLQCVSAVFAPTDLTNLPLMDAAIKTYLGANYSPAAVMAASPVYQISSRVGSPSFFLSHGTADSRVPYSQSSAFASALNGAGLSATLKSVDGADHAYTEDQTRAVANDIATFTASCLGI